MYSFLCPTRSTEQKVSNCMSHIFMKMFKLGEKNSYFTTITFILVYIFMYQDDYKKHT